MQPRPVGERRGSIGGTPIVTLDVAGVPEFPAASYGTTANVQTPEVSGPAVHEYSPGGAALASP